MTPEEQNLDKQLDRAIEMAGISLRDYFSTFRTYVTATTIVVATIGFLRDPRSSFLSGVVALLGLWICLQWHIATVGTRLTYRYYLKMVDHLQGRIKQRMLPRFDAKSDIEGGTPNYPWSSHQHLRPWGARGATLPVVYGDVFLVVLLDAFHPLRGPWAWIVGMLAAVCFVALTWLVSIERQTTPPWDFSKLGA